MKKLMQQQSKAAHKAGVRDRLLEAVSKAFDGELVMIDSSSIRLHQHGATLKGGPKSLHGTFPGRFDDQDPHAG
jgi:hypothetical protein